MWAVGHPIFILMSDFWIIVSAIIGQGHPSHHVASGHVVRGAVYSIKKEAGVGIEEAFAVCNAIHIK